MNDTQDGTLGGKSEVCKLGPRYAGPLFFGHVRAQGGVTDNYWQTWTGKVTAVNARDRRACAVLPGFPRDLGTSFAVMGVRGIKRLTSRSSGALRWRSPTPTDVI